MKDQFGRNIDYLRISVTDRCNLRCVYCMPKEGTQLSTHEEMLTFEEIERICRCGVSLGIRKIKLTGGEPLVKRGIVTLVKKLSGIDGVEDVTMTTNGCRLGELASELKQAGLSAVNVSLDTLNRERFTAISGQDELGAVLKGIDRAITAGLHVKINCAVINDDSFSEIPEFLTFAGEKKIPVRFIEMMPIGEGKQFDSQDNDSLRSYIERQYPALREEKQTLGNGPARYYRDTDSGDCVGFISAVHHKFCDSCNRVRLTSDGFLKRCLAGEDGINLRELMRMGISEEALTKVIRDEIWLKPSQHHFESAGADENKKTMNRIGG